MRTRLLAASLALLLLAIPGIAELDNEERTWTMQCIDKLQAKSERVRRSAEDALVSVGFDAIDALAAKSVRDDDPAWMALERVCVRIGRFEAAKRLDEIAAKDALRAKRLSALAARLRPAGGAARDLAMARRIEAILARGRNTNFFTPTDPIVEELVALGGAAVPGLLQELQPEGRHDADSHWAAMALERLVTSADVADVRTALLRGCDAAASGVDRLVAAGDEDALAALHEAVRKGVFGGRIACALEKSPDKIATARVVANWLRARSDAPEWDLGAAADLLGELGALETADAVAACAPIVTQEQPLFFVARAMVRLGRAEGIPILIRIVAGSLPDDDAAGFKAVSRFRGFNTSQERLGAAQVLNEVSGLGLAIVARQTEIPMTPESKAAFEAAAKEYSTWWASARDRLRFDPVARTWSVPLDK